ncbi:hypothetical protein [Sideroxydans lithotrophicus]|uniref:hypothetical protein n=1 Tax=Sideroxydans lithotrophicus TaxID=63745 RepID=UPI0002EB5793|nr:hypothetical protein [Sideroxydans lithotrophicus]
MSGPDSFLLYPNPQSSPAIDSQAYAQAYYAAIDPTNAKDTLVKWKAANGFGSGTGMEVQAVFGDVRDLGYGRYVTARKNTDGTIAFYVDNYLVWSAAGYGYSSLNLDAAVARDQRWYIGTNAIEFSPGPAGGAPFAKYFTFDPVTGARLLAANLDGRGNKAMPGICTGCHGGRGDPLTPPDAFGNQLFAVVGNPASGVRGDLKGKLHFFEPDTFSFSTLAGKTRPDQEAAIKTLNQWVLCTYPLPTSSVVPTGYAEDTCRNVATLDEWQGGAADIVKAAYGGNGLPNPAYADNYVPASWVAAGQTTLYQNVVQPACRMCHILRGIGQQSDADFSNFTAFQTSADRIMEHVIERGNMPLTKVLYGRYWSTPSMYNTMNTFLQNEGYTVLDAASAPLLPGRPIADAGLNRTVSTGATTLSAAGSMYADTFSWSIVSNPGSAATLSVATGVQTTFNATANGTYGVQLVASKGTVQSVPVVLTLVVNSALTPAPAAIRFSDIKAVLQAAGAGKCITCHTPAPAGNLPPSPIIYANVDRNGDGLVDATDDLWLYTEVRGRINFSDISGSPLLRKPSGHHHNGGVQSGFGDQVNKISADKLQPGDPLRANYDLFLNWISNGAPY